MATWLTCVTIGPASPHRTRPPARPPHRTEADRTEPARLPETLRRVATQNRVCELTAQKPTANPTPARPPHRTEADRTPARLTAQNPRQHHAEEEKEKNRKVVVSRTPGGGRGERRPPPAHCYSQRHSPPPPPPPHCHQPAGCRHRRRPLAPAHRPSKARQGSSARRRYHREAAATDKTKTKRTRAQTRPHS